MVDDLDRVSTNFAAFEYKLKNIMVLKQRLEALPAERVHGLTPERIYKLLEKERQKLSPAENTSGKKTQKFSWRKLINLGFGFGDPKLAVLIAVVASLSLSWLGGYSFGKLQETDSKTVETVKQTGNSSM